MQLRILRRTIKQYDRANDREYFEHYDRLQYAIGLFDPPDQVTHYDWKDVPIIEANHATDGEPK